jgi:hypothetical protein
MTDDRKPEDQVTEEDRRRFLKLAKDLGIGAGVVTVALARPDYAAASGFSGNKGDEDENDDGQGED